MKDNQILDRYAYDALRVESSRRDADFEDIERVVRALTGARDTTLRARDSIRNNDGRINAVVFVLNALIDKMTDAAAEYEVERDDARGRVSKYADAFRARFMPNDAMLDAAELRARRAESHQ